MEAAEATGHAGRPLPLFYALSQAGRGIAAAHRPTNWKLHGHGLGWDESVARDPLKQRLEPQGGDGTSFAGVAEAIGASRLTAPVELGALWSALPETTHLDFPTELELWPRAIRVVATNVDRNIQSAQVQVKLIGFPLPGDELPDSAFYTEHLALYPRTEDFALGHNDEVRLAYRTVDGTLVGIGHWPSGGPLADDRRAKLDSVAPEYRYRGVRHLLPRVGTGKDELQPLLLWWALLFGLSMYARYEPVRWAAALDVNTSRLAVPLEALLDEALDAVAHIVLDALTQDRALLESA